MDEYDGDNTTGAGWRGAGFSTTTCIYCGQGSTDVLNGRNKLLERKEESLNGELLDSHSGISGFRFFPIFPLFFYLGFFLVLVHGVRSWVKSFGAADGGRKEGLESGPFWLL